MEHIEALNRMELGLSRESADLSELLDKLGTPHTSLGGHATNATDLKQPWLHSKMVNAQANSILAGKQEGACSVHPH